MQKNKISTTISSFFILSLCLLSSGLWAQQPEQRRFSASILAGLNAAQIQGDAVAGYNKLGLNVGARGGVYLAPRFELATEILFSQQGSQSKFQRGVPRDVYYNLNYIEVPVLLYFKDWEAVTADNESYQKVWVGFGGSFNRLLGGKIETYAGPQGFTYLEGGELFDAGYRKNSYLFVADANFFFTRNWGFNLRWSRALVSIYGNKSNPRAEIPHMITFRAVFAF